MMWRVQPILLADFVWFAKIRAEALAVPARNDPTGDHPMTDAPFALIPGSRSAMPGVAS
ncbi:MAG TPA: hypothetical protein VMT83_04245 [Burkholderiaceae bacterium]|nr:hypothetical protein [Burkholderiaceae bacterium]